MPRRNIEHPFVPVLPDPTRSDSENKRSPERGCETGGLTAKQRQRASRSRRCPRPSLDAPDSLSRLIPSRVARGFFLAVVSGLFFTCLNASAKELASEMPPLYVVVGPLDRGHRR